MAKKRLNNEGSITYHKKWNLWLGRVSHEGKRIGIYRKSQAEVKKALKDLQLKKHQGIQLVNSSMLLKDYLPQWLKVHKNNLAEGTHEAYGVTLRVHLIPKLGRYKLNNISPEIITRAWSDMIEEGHSATIVAHCHRRLSKALNDAVRRNLIDRNPCMLVTKPKENHAEIHPLDSQEVSNVLKESEQTPYHAVIFMALQTGARRNELLALNWRDVDLNRSVIHISKTLQIGKGGEISFKSPKTKSSNRSIALSPEAVLFLRSELDKQISNDVMYVNENTPVFVSSIGDRLLPSAVSHGFKKIVRKLELNESINFHDTRHTHATILFIKGVHPKIVQERLGHSSIKVTLDIYSHVIPSMQEDAVKDFSLTY